MKPAVSICPQPVLHVYPVCGGVEKHQFVAVITVMLGHSGALRQLPPLPSRIANRVTRPLHSTFPAGSGARAHGLRAKAGAPFLSFFLSSWAAARCGCWASSASGDGHLAQASSLLSSSSFLIASWMWRGTMRFFLLSRAALPASCTMEWWMHTRRDCTQSQSVIWPVTVAACDCRYDHQVIKWYRATDYSKAPSQCRHSSCMFTAGTQTDEYLNSMSCMAHDEHTT
jgi:hypothetical protein